MDDWLPDDVDNILLVDGIDRTAPDRVNVKAARKLESLIVSHFSHSLPCIAMQAD